VAHIEKDRKMYKVSVGKPEGKRPLGRPIGRWNGIRMNLRKSGWEVSGIDSNDSG
jgi:hypothetical protein